jgi:hypothetical protein
MIYIRGNRLDYDTWRDAYGCAGWGYADLLPYFLRAEDQQRGRSAYHGTGGPLRVEDQRYEHPLSRAWLEAAVASGLGANDDFNGADQDGVGHYQMTQREGRRWSVADAYLRPAMARPNLTVQTDAHVSQVLLEGDRAAGVRYVRDGAVKTPQLLMLSGIGPADHLGAHRIPVVVDAPAVGAGLQDHPMCLPGWRTPGTRNLWEEFTPTTWSSGGGRGAARCRRSVPRPAASPAAAPIARPPTSSSAPFPGRRRSPSSARPASGRSAPSSAPSRCGAGGGSRWPRPTRGPAGRRSRLLRRRGRPRGAGRRSPHGPEDRRLRAAGRHDRRRDHAR